MYKAKTENLYIKHALNGLEYQVSGSVNGRHKNYKVDGYCVDTNTVYEFNGCKLLYEYEFLKFVNELNSF